MKTKSLILSAALSLCTLAASAQTMKTKVLADDHVMLRVNTADGYVLLPVEESQNTDHIRVISNNTVVQELNARLAVNKADYYVPLNVSRFNNSQSKSVLLDITVNRGDAANSASKAATSDLAVWKLIKTSNAVDMTNREKFRPLYHHTPAVGEYDVGALHKYRPHPLEV